MVEVAREVSRANTKHGPNLHSRHDGHSVILEEMDEFWDNVKANKHKEALEEVTQVAAMAVKYLMCFG